MKRIAQILPLLLAAVLQLMPMLRNVIMNPAVGSNFAFILRWGIGTGAAIGTVDAVSGASGTVMNTSSNITGTVGVFQTNSINFVINGGNTADTASDYMFLNTKPKNAGTSSAQLFNTQTTTFALPAGLTLKCVVINNQPNIYAALTGTPTTAVTTNISITAGYTGGYTFTTNLLITIAAGGGTPPTISAQPVGVTNVAGGNAIFSVTAAGTPTPAYQWRFNTTTPVSGATASTLNLTGIRASQAGNYTVVITNSAGSITSSVAVLGVTTPASPVCSAPQKTVNGFQFTFVPVVGLTNTVLANGALNGGSWTTFSNVPPPVSASPVTITDNTASTNKFYRVMVQP